MGYVQNTFLNWLAYGRICHAVSLIVSTPNGQRRTTEPDTTVPSKLTTTLTASFDVSGTNRCCQE